MSISVQKVETYTPPRNYSPRRPFSLPQHCKFVFLDVGSNIGVQTRKLFEPEKYENANITSYFSKYFGSREQRDGHTCAVGFEPNPRLEKRLKIIQEHYTRKGHFVHFFTRTAVSTFDGHTHLFGPTDTDTEPPGDGVVRDIGASLLPEGYIYDPAKGKQNKKLKVLANKRFNIYDPNAHLVASRYLDRAQPGVEVKAVDLSSLVNDLNADVIVMKMDIEGIEYKVLSKMLIDGSLCKVSALLIEWHSWFFRDGSSGNEVRMFEEVLPFILEQHPNCDTQVIALDDESYDMDGQPF